MTITRRAPGKLFIVGEYAVLEPGRPAVLAAVDRYATATVTDSAYATTMTSDLPGNPQIRCVRGENRPVSMIGHPLTDFGYALAAATLVERLVLESGSRPRPFELEITSTGLTDPSGRKLGLGSSAAVTVATIAALGAFYQLPLTPTDRYRLAMLATLTVNSNASGGDVAAATWGGWIAYHSPDRHRVIELANSQEVTPALLADWPGLSVQLLAPPARARLLVGWSGQPSSTRALTERSNDRRHLIRDYDTFLIDSTTCVEKMITAVQADDVTAMQSEIRRSRALLHRLDQEAELGIYTPQLNALCTAADLVGAAAKPSGAGGGDCGIAIADVDRFGQERELIHQWIDSGVQPVTLQTHPSEGNSDDPAEWDW
ncbi:phosphomevalonate kinase [Nocardia brasiliensis]|uniref:phosphomevalonate kinase n=1 Tax=Nocardia brasiliensis TaxID=37326 RepID=UPI0024587517|nr:phosphomevalonate kinase [Nocardia brasiliensis]